MSRTGLARGGNDCPSLASLPARRDSLSPRWDRGRGAAWLANGRLPQPAHSPPGIRPVPCRVSVGMRRIGRGRGALQGAALRIWGYPPPGGVFSRAAKMRSLLRARARLPCSPPTLSSLHRLDSFSFFPLRSSRRIAVRRRRGGWPWGCGPTLPSRPSSPRPPSASTRCASL